MNIQFLLQACEIFRKYAKKILVSKTDDRFIVNDSTPTYVLMGTLSTLAFFVLLYFRYYHGITLGAKYLIITFSCGFLSGMYFSLYVHAWIHNQKVRMNLKEQEKKLNEEHRKAQNEIKKILDLDV